MPADLKECAVVILQHLFSGQLKILGNLPGRDPVEQNGNNNALFYSGQQKERLPQILVPFQTNEDKEGILMAEL